MVSGARGRLTMSFPETGHEGLIVMQTCPCLFPAGLDLRSWQSLGTALLLMVLREGSRVLFILGGFHDTLEYVKNIPSASSLRGRAWYVLWWRKAFREL